MKLLGYVLMPIDYNDRTYFLHFPLGAPFDEAREVLSRAIQDIDIYKIELEKLAAEKAAAESAGVSKEVSAEVVNEPTEVGQNG